MVSRLFIISVLFLMGCQNRNFQVGEYNAYTNWTYDLEIWKDSTFRYIKRYEWPVEVSVGKWHIEGNRLILNSIPDPEPPPANVLRTGNYVMFHKIFVIRNRKLIEDSIKLKYKLYKNIN